MPADDISTSSVSPVAAEASLSDEEVASITGSTERLVRAHVYHNRFIRGWQRLRQRYPSLVAEESESHLDEDSFFENISFKFIFIYIFT